MDVILITQKGVIFLGLAENDAREIGDSLLRATRQKQPLKVKVKTNTHQPRHRQLINILAPYEFNYWPIATPRDDLTCPF